MSFARERNRNEKFYRYLFEKWFELECKALQYHYPHINIQNEKNVIYAN